MILNKGLSIKLCWEGACRQKTGCLISALTSSCDLELLSDRLGLDAQRSRQRWADQA